MFLRSVSPRSGGLKTLFADDEVIEKLPVACHVGIAMDELPAEFGASRHWYQGSDWPIK